MIGLCDCNNFYVSCERLFNPSLEGRAVVVMSSNDGCVIARSNEAKALGIKMGQPQFQIKELLRRENVKVLSTNLQLYGDISQRVMYTLQNALPAIEVYSIDEAFLDFREIEVGQRAKMGRELSHQIRRNVGIPVSIGISHTKTLAKVAAQLCKRYSKLEGSCLMERDEDIKKVLSSYSIADVWGIGRRSTQKLLQYNIKTAEQFRSAPREWVRSQMGLNGERSWEELNGVSCIEIDNSPHARQSIMVSRSFSHEISSLEELMRYTATFASRACEKLRAQGSTASQLQVFVMTNRFRDNLPQHNESRIHIFETATSSTIEVVTAAGVLLREMIKPGISYKKTGVVLMGIGDKRSTQTSLFDALDRAKHGALMETMDRINASMGRETLKLGAQGDGQIATLSKEQSPCYTTRWEDILTIKL